MSFKVQFVPLIQVREKLFMMQVEQVKEIKLLLKLKSGNFKKVYIKLKFIYIWLHHIYLTKS